MAARTLLLKLERSGYIRLPERRGPSPNGRRNRDVPVVEHATEPIRGALRELRPLAVSVVAHGWEDMMYFDGRYKIAVYHGHEIGEIYDLEADPGEFQNLWDDPRHGTLKLELLKRHFDAMMSTSSAGVPRTRSY